MKKKLIFSLIAATSLFSLASCSGSSNEDLTVIRSDKDSLDLSLVKDKYKLNFIDDLNNLASRLDKTQELDEGQDYYAIYTPNNITECAYVYQVSVDSDLAELGERVQNYSYNALTFKTANNIYTSEESEIASKLYNSDNGLHQYNDSFQFEVNTLAALSFNITAKHALTAYNNGARDITLNIVYVPTYVVRNYGKDSNKQHILEKVLFAPIYACYESNGKEINIDGDLVDSKISTLSKIDFSFEGNYVSTEKPVEELN